jgi:hypothetical protein
MTNRFTRGVALAAAAFLFTLLIPATTEATLQGSPFPPAIDARFHAIESGTTPNFSMTNGETIVNSTDDTIDFLSDDSHMTHRLTGYEAKNAILELCADQCDDTADKYSIKADTSDVLSILNGSTVLFSSTSAGVLTLPDSETLTNASDVVTWAFDDAAAEVRLNAFEATNSSLTLQADESDDSGDDWQISSVASGNAFTISNDTSGSQVAKFSMAASDGDITLTGGLIGDGGDAEVGFLKNQITSTTTGLTIAQCGSTIINDSADVLTLPEASTALGCRYTFVVANASNLDINPNDGTDQILAFADYAGAGATISPSAGDAIRGATVGMSITVEAVGANAWAVIGGAQGTWADVN